MSVFDVENLKVTRKYRFFSLAFSLYERTPHNLTLKRMNRMDRLCIDSSTRSNYFCIIFRRVLEESGYLMQLERDPRSKDMKRGKEENWLVLGVLSPSPPQPVSFYSYDRVHPSIALWESKDVFRENEDDCSSSRCNAISPFIYAVEARILRNPLNLKS